MTINEFLWLHEDWSTEIKNIRQQNRWRNINVWLCLFTHKDIDIHLVGTPRSSARRCYSIRVLAGDPPLPFVFYFSSVNSHLKLYSITHITSPFFRIKEQELDVPSIPSTSLSLFCICLINRGASPGLTHDEQGMSIWCLCYLFWIKKWSILVSKDVLRFGPQKWEDEHLK